MRTHLPDAMHAAADRACSCSGRTPAPVRASAVAQRSRRRGGCSWASPTAPVDVEERATSSSAPTPWPLSSAADVGLRLNLLRLERSFGEQHRSQQEDDFAAVPFQLQTEDKPQRTKNQEKTPDYYANVGDAIRTLREDIPSLFERDLNYGIYREDILFKDPRNIFQGLKNYRLMFWSLRFHGRIFFSKLYVEVKRIWQPPCEDGIIKLRWTVHGIPRVPWEAEGTFDGISTYKLDQSGKIYEHAVDNVLLRDPPMLRNPLLAGLNLAPLEPQTPQLGAWFTDEPQEQQQPAQQQPGHCLASSTTQQQQQPAAAALHQSQQHGGYQGLHAQGHQQHQQPQQRHWMASVTFSWVRLYASLLATVQLAAVRFSSEQQHSQQQHACAGAGAASGGCGELPLGSEN